MAAQSFEGRRATTTNLYTLEGVYENGHVSSVIATSPRIRTVRGFLRADPRLLKKALRMRLVNLFVRHYRAHHGEYLEYNETADQLDLVPASPEEWYPSGRDPSTSST